MTTNASDGGRVGALARLNLSIPLIQAPMGGGFTPPALVAAVSKAGGLGSLAAPYLEPEAIGAEISAVRALTDRPFAVNLFIFDPPTATAAQLDRASAVLGPYCRELGIDPPTPPAKAHPDIDRQIAAVLEAQPAVFSFTFGIPRPEVLAECRRLGIITIGTATTLAEGLALEAAGVDLICAQGSEAGAHHGTFIGPAEEGLVGLMALLTTLVAKLKTPIVAAGGIMTGAGISAALRVGAVAAQLGTAFLACPEAGTPGPHRRVLLSDAAQRTRVTRAFSGRAARGVVNRYLEEVEPLAGELPPFPILNAMTREMRGAAAKADRAEFMSLWAGQGVALIRELPAATLVETLKAELAAVS